MSGTGTKPLMGRLFWKFFLFLWLAQLLTSIGVGALIWLERNEHSEAARDGGFHRRPPPTAALNGAPTDSPPTRDERPPPPPGSPRLLPPLMPILAGSIVSLVFAALLAAYFARPIRNLREALGAISEGRLETRVSPRMGRRRDELAALGVEFDRMAERLQTVLEGQRRLLHDVSHELRSPLARLQVATELLRQQPDRGVVFIERIERDTNRMSRLVGELLTLARLGAGVEPDMNERVELMALLSGIAEDANLEAEARACRVELSGTGVLAMRGNAELIRRALENVVRNAIRYSPQGGRVSIALRTAAEGAVVLIDVADEGPGVDAADLSALFEPFFRSRAEDSYSGFGLGLAISREVVERHGGMINAANRREGGLLVQVRLPAI